jgi:hypothetical protein
MGRRVRIAPAGQWTGAGLVCCAYGKCVGTSTGDQLHSPAAPCRGQRARRPRTQLGAQRAQPGVDSHFRFPGRFWDSLYFEIELSWDSLGPRPRR